MKLNLRNSGLYPDLQKGFKDKCKDHRGDKEVNQPPVGAAEGTKKSKAGMGSKKMRAKN